MCSQGTSAFVLITNFYVVMLKLFTEITFQNQPMKRANFSVIQIVSLVGRQYSVNVCKISDPLVRNRAYVLQDTAYSIVMKEMDAEFG